MRPISYLRRFSKALVVIFMLFANFGTSTSAMKVTALVTPTTIEYPNPGSVVIDKTDSDIGGGLYEITLNLSGVPLVKSSDIVLVIDISGSMEGEKIDAAKLAAEDFVDVIISKNQNHRIAIVSFESAPLLVHDFSMDAISLKSAIEDLSSSGGTHLEGGIYVATELLSSSGLEANNKVIIVLGDGQPTYGYDFNAIYTGPLNYSEKNDHCRVSVSDSNQEIAANFSGRFDFDYLNQIGEGNSIYFEKEITVSGTCPFPIGGTDDYRFDKQYSLEESVYWQADRAKNLGYSIFSIGLEVNSTGDRILNYIQNSGYYDAESDDLSAVYNAISSQIVYAARNAVVLDKIGDDFEFVRISDGFEMLDSDFDPITRVLTWSVGNVGATSLILKYIISIHPGLPNGEYPTNEYAIVNYVNIFEESNGMTFPQPTVIISIQNEAPVALDQSVTTPEDTPIDITLSGSDVDGDTLVYTVLSDPANGTLTGTAPDLHYTPIENYFGIETFTFSVNDGHVDSNIATVTITVGGINDAPIAYTQTLSTPEDTGLDILLTGFDTEGSTLSFYKLTDPASGVLSGTGANLHFEPAANFAGQVSFTFKVNDGLDDSNIATITINVIAVNDAPIADDQTLSTPEDTGLDIVLTGSDTESDPLTYFKLSDPLSGVLSGSGANLQYQPAANFFGQVTFTFRVNDGNLNSDTATITINVGAVNDAPIAYDQDLTTFEDVNLDITLTGSDSDGDSLNYTVLIQPLHGSLVGSGAALTYVPEANYFGPDSFTYKVDDGTEDSNIATIDIDVTSVNDAPMADGQSLSTSEDTGLDILLTGSDPEDDPLDFIITLNPLHGVLSGTGANVHYEPYANYFGPDSFKFKVNDGDLDSPEVMVSLTITPVNDAPIADDDEFTVEEGGVYSGHVWAHDVDPHAVPASFTPSIISFLNYSVVVSPQYGNLVFNLDGSFTYTHNGSENHIDFFTFKANDGQLDSNVARVDIEVTPVNDAPVATPQAFIVVSGTLYHGNLVANDVDLTDTLTWSVVQAPLYGTLIIHANGTYDYQHNGANILPDSFTYKVNDGLVDSNTALVNATITPLPPLNTPPTTNPEAITLNEGASITNVVEGADADGNPITFVLVNDVTHGTLNFNVNGTYTYTHNGTETIADTFDFRSYDGLALSAVRTATITITPVNDAPVAVNGEDQTDFNTVLTGNVHDLISDVDSANWTILVVNNVAHGTLVLNANGTFTYTPNSDFSGEDSFTFRANDGSLTSNIATFTITVQEEVIIVDPQTPLGFLNYWYLYLLGLLLLLLLFFLRPNLKYALVDKNGKETTIRRHIFANGKDDLFIDLNDKNIEGLVKVDLVVYKQLVKREQGKKITFNLFEKPAKVIAVPEDMKEAIEDQIKL